MDWQGCHVYGIAQDPFGTDAMAAYATDFQSDFILTNMDIWVIQTNLFFDKKWVAWIPIDSEPIPPLVEEKAREAFHRIVWTKFGAREMDDAGLDYDRVPYGIDTQMFYPGDREQARITATMPPDRFIVGMVAMNKGYPSRKAFFENIAAFKVFHDRHPDAFLYLHTVDGSKPNAMTVDLALYCRRIGLHPEDYMFADQYSMLTGFPEHAMNTLYNCMDVHLLVSMGEGFGLPQVEAQACGVPVICGDWTAMPELLFAGWKVERNECVPMYTLQNTYQFVPMVHAIVERLEQAYRARGDKELAEKARAGALEYDIDKVVEKYWVPALANIEKKIKETPNLNLTKSLEVLR
jgi:glycosyltransferase involved in cell wall biosynthesis